MAVGSSLNETAPLTTFNTTANCTEQLNLCIKTYNSLLNDYNDKSGCGTAFNLLKSNNKALGEERDELKKRVENLKQYKVAFYIVLILFIILIIMYFKVSRNLNNNGRLQDGRRKDKRKEEDR